MFRQKSFEQWEKNYPSYASPVRIEKSHSLSYDFTRDLASLIPSQNSDLSGKISLAYMDTHNGFL